MMSIINIFNRKTQLSLIECGIISNSHIASIAKHRNRYKLVDVFDISPLARREGVKQAGPSGHRNLSDLLHKTSANHIILTTPGGLYPMQAIEVAKSEKTS